MLKIVNKNMRKFYVTFETWSYTIDDGGTTKRDWTYVVLEENEKADHDTFIRELNRQGYTIDFIFAWSLVEE